MFPMGHRPAMIPRDVRHEIDFVGGEPRQVAIFNQIVRMFMMLPGIDHIADVVQNRRELQPFAFPLPKSMQEVWFDRTGAASPSHMEGCTSET